MPNQEYLILTEVKGNLKNPKTLQFIVRRYKIDYKTHKQYVCTKVANYQSQQKKRLFQNKENIPYEIGEWPITGAIRGKIYFTTNSSEISQSQIENQIATLKRALYDSTHLSIEKIENIKTNLHFLH